MSIQSEINRISQNVADSLTAVAAKGVVVPSGSNSDDLPELIASIQTGSGSAVTVTDTLDANGGIIRTISAVSLAGDTVNPSTLLSGTTAHNALGQSITGTYEALPCPIFDILNDGEGHEISITCNKTFDECLALIDDSTYTSLSAIVRERGQTVDDAPDAWDHAYSGVYYNGSANPKYLRYYSTNASGVPTFQLTYYNDGTITNSFENIDPILNLDVTQNGTYSALPYKVYGTVTVNVPATSTEPNLQEKKNISPSTSSQTITADSGYDGLSSVQINAMPTGTAGTPTAAKGTVSNHSVTVTPSVTNTTGYITGGTKTGTAVTVSASELVSGTKTIDSNGTGIDVTNYATVTVAVPATEPNLQSKSGINPSTSSQTITPDSGYDGLSSVQINAMPEGSASLMPNVMGTSASVSTGTNTLTLSKQITITPYVEPGYISSGEATECSVSLTASVTTKGTATITPTKSAQTIASGTYLTGTQTIAAIPAAYQDVTGVTASASDVVSGKDIVNSSGTVVHGSLVIQHYYTGSSAPSSSTGANGDIYLQTS